MEFQCQDRTSLQPRSLSVNDNPKIEMKNVSGSTDFKYLSDVIISALLIFSVSLTGVVVNGISLAVFLQQKRHDNVSVALISLCVSDLGMTLLSLGTSLCYAWKLADPSDSADADSVLYVAFFWQYSMLYDISVFTTVLISVERFLCVAIPLKVKDVVTTPRMLTAIVFIYLYNVAIFCPLFKTQELHWSQTSSRNNSSSLVVWLSDDRQIFENVVFYINVLGLIVGAQIIVMICSAGMVYGLIMSKQFNEKFPKFETKSQKPDIKASRLKKKELVLVKTVLFIALLFCVSNSNLVAFTFAIMFNAEFKLDGAYSGAYLLCSAIVRLCTVLTAAGNGCIYFKLSSKFRRAFQSCFFGPKISGLNRKANERSIL